MKKKNSKYKKKPSAELGITVPDDYTKADNEINRNFFIDNGATALAPKKLDPLPYGFLSGDNVHSKKKRTSNTNWLMLGLLGLDALIPERDKPDNNSIIQPQDTYNPYPEGTGSSALFGKGGKLSSEKAKEMLRDGTANGKKLTDKQKRYFGYIAGGGKADGGLTLDGPGDPETKKKRLADLPYYDKLNSTVEFNYYGEALQKALRKKNPQGFDTFINEAAGQLKKTPNINEQDFQNAIENSGRNTKYQDFLSDDEIKTALSGVKPINGTDPYQRFSEIQDMMQTNKYGISKNYGTSFKVGDNPAIDQRQFNYYDIYHGYSTSLGKDNGEYYKPRVENGQIVADTNIKKPKVASMPMAKMKAGGKIKQLSNNMFDGGTKEFVGPSHDDGGIDMSYGGKQAEVEGGEPTFVDNQGALNIMGNMYIPGTKTKFKQATKEIAKTEQKYMKHFEEGVDLINNNQFTNPFQRLKFNAGKVMVEGNLLGQEDLATKKELLSNLQQRALSLAGALGVDPIAMSQGKTKKAKKGMKIPMYEAGGTDPGDPTKYKAMLKKAADKYGVQYEVLQRLVGQESNFNLKAKSNKGALSLMQFMPTTAKGYGISEDMLRSTKDEDVEKVIDGAVHHFKNLLSKNNDDYTLALAAYNGGQGVIEHVKKGLGRRKISGSDLYGFLKKEREISPSDDPAAWSNQTFDYIKNITTLSDEDFAIESPKFRANYYERPLTDKPVAGLEPNPKQKKNKYKDPLFPDIPVRKITAPEDNIVGTTNPLDLLQIAPELLTLATNRTQPVQAQKYQPDLFEPYNVSFQDKLNENQATFNAVKRATADNPAALGTFAAQKYAADNQVLGEEFRTNQGIANDITNKNTSLLNDAQLKNLGIADQQYVRQSTAKSKTKSQLFEALNSVSGKFLQNKLENTMMKIYEPLFDYRLERDQYGNITKFGHQNTGDPFQYQEQASPNEGGGYGDNPATKEKIVTDGNGTVKKAEYSTPSAVTQQMDAIKLQKAQQTMTLSNMFNDLNYRPAGWRKK